LAPRLNRFTWLPTVNRRDFFMNILGIEFFFPQRKTQQNAVFRQYIRQGRSPFWLLKPASEHVHAHLLLRLSWNWIVLLPSDIHRKPITSITTVLLPSVTYLLTLPSISVSRVALIRAGQPGNRGSIFGRNISSRKVLGPTHPPTQRASRPLSLRVKRCQERESDSSV
jgi:hypothetical protein